MSGILLRQPSAALRECFNEGGSRRLKALQILFVRYALASAQSYQRVQIDFREIDQELTQDKQ
jgi:hypothetical protein